MSISFSWWALIIFPLAFYFLHRWPKKEVEVIEDSRVGVFRRLAAVYIDLAVAMIGILPIITLPGLFIEYLYTGEWAWVVKREPKSRDMFHMAILLLGFLGIYAYARWHFKRSRQTLGQHFMGFKLISTDANDNFGVRVLTAWVIGAWWPFWPWTLMGRKQDYLWDTVSNIKARRVQAK